MIENTDNSASGSYALSKAGEALAAKRSSAFKALQVAIRDLKKARRLTADDAFVSRVNDRVDAALEAPITTLTEAEAKGRLFLLSEREDLHEIQVAALESIADVLATVVKASAN